jgi:trehalose 6-phosphate phosphatase
VTSVNAQLNDWTSSAATKQRAFCDLVPNATERLLMLDYDGTLAPFVKDRDHAYPYPEIPELIDELMRHCGTRVVVVSGREADEIPFLLRTSRPIEVWGCHGLERCKPDGSYWRAPLPTEVEEAFSCVGRDLAQAGMSTLSEVKAGGVAVHWRGLTPLYAQEVKGAAYQLFSKYINIPGLLVQAFDEGVELRSRGCNKAEAVRNLLAECSEDAAIAYLGDDTTDEDAFRALAGRGITILVRPTFRFTAAQFWVRPPDELIGFFRAWIRACKEGE